VAISKAAKSVVVPLALVFVCKAGERLTVGQPNPAHCRISAGREGFSCWHDISGAPSRKESGVWRDFAWRPKETKSTSTD
jgi:hypothetical protein